MFFSSQRRLEIVTVALFACLASGPASAFSQDQVNVEQLIQRVDAEHNRSDANLAHRLQNLQLTQRLSNEHRRAMHAALPGPESRNALLALADLSEVLDPPANEIPSGAPPTPEEQTQILAKATGSANPAARQLPDFDAAAITTRFRNFKYFSPGSSTPVPLVVPYPLMLSRGVDEITHREGRAIVTHSSRGWVPDDAVNTGAENWDNIYELLSSVTHDMASLQADAPPQWLRWEQGPSGKLAVFHFSVDQARAHFAIHTGVDTSFRHSFASHPGYRAEIALDPVTGEIYRFVLRATLDPGQRILRADTVLEFSPATVGGKSFLCPYKAITIGVSQSLLGPYDRNYVNGEYRVNLDVRPLTHLVDLQFTGYRPGASKPPAVADPAFLASAVKTSGEQVTVEQLEKIVSDLSSNNDRSAAQRLGQLDLTQRLTADRYAKMRQRLPGKASIEALLALYDISEFNDLPKADLAQGDVPDTATQGKIVTSAVEYVSRVSHTFPDLFATRQLGRFEDLRVVRGNPNPLLAEVKPLVMVDQSTGTVHFRENREVVDTTSKDPKGKSAENGLDTWGTFAPILENVVADVMHARIGWGHWESGPSGRLAVFRYAVPANVSQYTVKFCCYLGQDGLPSSFSATPAYHGELAIDPATGAVMRLVLKADFRPDPANPSQQEASPLLFSNVMVEYGAVDVAGRQYICPVRSISYLASWTLGSSGPLKRQLSKPDGAKAAKDAIALMEFSRVNAINETEFRDYHVFRSESRLLPAPDDAGTPAPKH
jgi:hypothetical protein